MHTNHQPNCLKMSLQSHLKFLKTLFKTFGWWRLCPNVFSENAIICLYGNSFLDPEWQKLCHRSEQFWNSQKFTSFEIVYILGSSERNYNLQSSRTSSKKWSEISKLVWSKSRKQHFTPSELKVHSLVTSRLNKTTCPFPALYKSAGVLKIWNNLIFDLTYQYCRIFSRCSRVALRSWIWR